MNTAAKLCVRMMERIDENKMVAHVGRMVLKIQFFNINVLFPCIILISSGENISQT